MLEAEFDQLTETLEGLAAEKNLQLAEQSVDDVLTYALFPQIGLKFLENRGNPQAFEPASSTEPEVTIASAPALVNHTGAAVYTVKVNGNPYTVEVAEGGDVTQVAPSAAPVATTSPESGEIMPAPLAGNIWKVNVAAGQSVQEGDVVLILEAMKMETEVRAPRPGQVVSVSVREGDSVAVGDPLLALA